jgi:Sensors of blue-light using FAD
MPSLIRLNYCYEIPLGGSTNAESIAHSYQEANINGCCFSVEDQYFQCIEGDRRAILALYDRLCIECGFTSFKLISIVPISECIFSGLGMTLLGPGDLDHLLGQAGLTANDDSVLHDAARFEMLIAAVPTLLKERQIETIARQRADSDIRLSYHSSITDRSDAVFSEILSESLHHNLLHDVTACLFRHDGRYFQFIEGARDTVLDLYHRIKIDSRHRDVQLAQIVQIGPRLFNRWSMATLSETDVTEIANRFSKPHNLIDSAIHDQVLAKVADILRRRESAPGGHAGLRTLGGEETLMWDTTIDG